eukprot:TRINITY_DN16158_c0_g1_i1.p1 TRINITY_DN16158_c0_g1~~TRINITY_DN16158_c0_g1_i1.p1  ORF type:complete len:416 (+),score=42.17 TRINITY_DN16158_c0_g1_i1:48-1295(+)
MLLQGSLFEVLLYLEVEEYVPLGLVCKKWWNQISNPALWRVQCKMVWAVSEEDMVVGEEMSMFRELASQYWKYRAEYSGIKYFWDDLKKWMKAESPRMLSTLRPPATEEDLDLLEKHTGSKLPLELRCFYKFHNGQEIDVSCEESLNLPLPNLDGIQVSEYVKAIGKASHDLCLGMFGGWSLYDMHVSMGLIPLNKIIQQIPQNTSVIPFARDLTGSTRQLLVQFLAGPRNGAIAWSGGRTGYQAAASLQEYLKTFMNRIKEKIYRPRLGEIQLYPCGNALGATTTEMNGMRIEASPLLVPHQSDDGMQCFAYRLTITSVSATCQLRTRTWYTRDSNMQNTHVVLRGNAIVGYCPSFKPGDSWEYASATRSTEDWSQFGGSLSFIPGTLMNPEGPEFDCDIDPMTLTLNHDGDST